jgi:hypothetical protein
VFYLARSSVPPKPRFGSSVASRAGVKVIDADDDHRGKVLLIP